MEFSKSLLIFLLVLAPIVLGLPSPYYDDDEYDDDPELPDRKQTAKEQQEQEEAMNEEEAASESESESSLSSTTTTSTTSKPHKLSPILKKKWAHIKQVRGYHILSDGPFIRTEYVKTRPMLRIRVESPDTVRDVQKTWHNQTLEVKIRNWNRVHKIHVKVPFGYEPDELKVAELKDHISIIAPIYADVDESEYRNILARSKFIDEVEE